MNVDELRDALREPAPVPLTVDLAEVLGRGRRRRAARRAAVPLAVLATAAAVAVPVALVGTNGPAQVETAGPGTTAVPARSSRPAVPQPPFGTGAIPKAAFDDVIATGEQVAGKERVFRFYPTEPDARLQSRFILGLGYRAPGGPARSVDGSNEIDGRDDTSGFHAVVYTKDGPVLPAGDWAVFGYYAGPAAQVTARIDGTVVKARTARWPGYPRIVVFWFSPGTGSPTPSSNTGIVQLHAYDAAGLALPAGPHTQVGAG
jgi:hypothetical protein